VVITIQPANELTTNELTTEDTEKKKE